MSFLTSPKSECLTLAIGKIVSEQSPELPKGKAEVFLNTEETFITHEAVKKVVSIWPLEANSEG